MVSFTQLTQFFNRKNKPLKHKRPLMRRRVNRCIIDFLLSPNMNAYRPWTWTRQHCLAGKRNNNGGMQQSNSWSKQNATLTQRRKALPQHAQTATNIHTCRLYMVLIQLLQLHKRELFQLHFSLLLKRMRGKLWVV